MSDKAKIKVDLKINGELKTLTFEPNMTAYNKWINEISPDNKVAPSQQYLRRIVSEESKAELNTLLETVPGAGMKLTGRVNEIYAPDLEFEVKD